MFVQVPQDGVIYKMYGVMFCQDMKQNSQDMVSRFLRLDGVVILVCVGDQKMGYNTYRGDRKILNSLYK